MSKKKLDRPLTKKFIDDLTTPGRYPHGVVPCVYLRVRPKTLSKDWQFISARTGDIGLGSWTGAGGAGIVSIPMAGKKGLAIHAQLAEGRDPRAEKLASLMTFGKCGNALLTSLKQTFKNRKTEESWTRSLTKHAAAIADKPVGAVTVEDVLGILKPLWLTQSETAKQLRGRVERTLDWAEAMGHRSGPNPARWRGCLDHLLPPRPKLQRGHHPAVPYSELPSFVAGLDLASDPALVPLLLTVLTGVRSGETTYLDWAEIDFDKALWTVPKSRTKTKERDHLVPLSKAAMALMTARKDEASEGRVFPDLKDGDMLVALRKLAADVTIHGFRSSLKDWATNETNFGRETIEEILDHRTGDETERAYRRGEAIKKRRVVLDAWSTYVTGKQTGNVLAFRR
ncbi:tyrosine-type recombinase/integrase [Phyllobacterium sp. P5_D12]